MGVGCGVTEEVFYSIGAVGVGCGVTEEVFYSIGAVRGWLWRYRGGIL